MSEDKDDDKVRTRFDELEKQIVTDGFNPGGKPDFLTQRNKKHRMRGLDSPTVLREQESVPSVVPPSVLRASALTVVYLVVLAGFAWTGWNATVGYLGTHGSGTEGRVVVAKCGDGSWFAPGVRCSGFFVPTGAAQLRQGVVVTEGVSTLGAGKSSKGKQVHGRMLSVGDTVYTSGWNGWMWYGLSAIVLLALLLFLTFRRHGLVPGIRASMAARSARRARVHAQEQAKDRARELRKKRAAEARAKADADKKRAKDEAAAEQADPDEDDPAVEHTAEPAVEHTAEAVAQDGEDTAAKPDTATVPEPDATPDAEQPDVSKADATAAKKPEKARKVVKPRPPARRTGKAGGKSPAHVGTAIGTTQAVDPEDLTGTGDDAEHTGSASTSSEVNGKGD